MFFENESVEYSSLDMDGKIKMVNNRLGCYYRISHPKELQSMIGSPIYLSVSAFDDVFDVNGTILTWVVGEIIKISKEGLLVINNINDFTFNGYKSESYLCLNYNDSDISLSLLDFNIIPNEYNNHAAFTSLKKAKEYVKYRKHKWKKPDDNKIHGKDIILKNWYTDISFY